MHIPRTYSALTSRGQSSQPVSRRAQLNGLALVANTRDADRTTAERMAALFKPSPNVRFTSAGQPVPKDAPLPPKPKRRELPPLLPRAEGNLRRIVMPDEELLVMSGAILREQALNRIRVDEGRADEVTSFGTMIVEAQISHCRYREVMRHAARRQKRSAL